MSKQGQNKRNIIVTIKEKAELYRATVLYELQDTARKMDVPKEKREASDELWEETSMMAGHGFKEGAVWSLIQIRHAIEDAPEGSDIDDVTRKKIIELLEGL